MEIEKKRPALNDEQQAAAFCSANAVVAAGAGSGKTMVLASRFVWLVTEKKIRVREILTLTFTKKATAQMYRRIYQLLAEIANDDSGEKGKLARRALDEFAHARIQTLDSYSAAIVKQAANRYGISPAFVIDEWRCKQIALEESRPYFLKYRGHPAMERFYPHKSPMSIAENTLASTLYDFTPVDSDPRKTQDIGGQFAVICQEWKKQTDFIEKKMRELAGVYPGNEKYHPDIAPILRQYTAEEIVFPKEQELRVFFDQLVKMPHNAVVDWAETQPTQIKIKNCLDFVLSLTSINMIKGSPRINPAKDIVREIRDLFGEFSSLTVYCIQAGIIFSMLTLLSNLQERYLARKRAEGVLTFGDVSRLARTILLEQHDIRQSEKESFRAIMIDEFQDNNELQKDILFFLAEKPEVSNNTVPSAADLSPDKLFFVGDEKQSVYLFRGADVSVFRALKDELGGRELSLKTNYRSSPLLIGAFNAIFGGNTGQDGEKKPSVFASGSLPAADLPPFEASFTPLRAQKKDEGKLTLCLLDSEDEAGFLDPVENEARYVAEHISRLLREKNSDGGQKYQPHDIAILFRTRGPQHLFEKQLMMLNIPYASENLSGFFLGGPVNDLMSVLRLVAYPADRAAYAQMLRSPFAGLSIQALAVCLTAAPFGVTPFGDEPLSLLGEEDREKYCHGRRVYQKILESACTESVSSLISELWYGEGYRYETEWNPKTAAYREMYDYLFHLAALADGNNQGLAKFTDDIHELYKTGGHLEDIEIPLDRGAERASAVHLMTVHKSKGLEFPVVFLCCCGKRGRFNTSGDVFDTGGYGLTFNPPLPPKYDNNKNIKRNYFWVRSLAVDKAKKTAELRRLLYVGMTRAEKELYLTGSLGISKDAEQEDEDFPQSVKRYIDKKTAETADKNNIPGDTIINDDTFFGLCLPAFGAHIAAPPNPDGFFFGIEKIPVYGEQYGRKQAGSLFSNDQQGLNKFFEIIEPLYSHVPVIQTPDIPKGYFSPASLPFLTVDCRPGGYVVNNAYSGVNAEDIFNKVDTLLDNYAKQRGDDNEKFNSGSFGTIAHICAEALLSNQDAVIPPKLAGFLTPKDAGAFLEAGKEIALRFVSSPLGTIAKSSKERKNEFPFRSLIYAGDNEIFINGIIDLLFEDQQTVYVVDFKTDVQETPGEHIAQMACYYRAAMDLFAVPVNKNCKIWLYYLRSGHAIEVTRHAREFDLEKITGK